MKQKTWLLAPAMVLLGVALWGCGPGGTTPPPPPPPPPAAITSITINTSSPAVTSGQSIQVAAIVTGTGAFDPKATFTVVSGGGTISNPGDTSATYNAPPVTSATTATIRATATGDATKTATTNVTINPAGNNDVAILKRPSKSSAVAITSDDKRVIMANTEDNSISVFEVPSFTRVAKINVGLEPVSVVIHPDNKKAYVAVRGDAKVVQINGIDTSNPSLGPSANVGSEPTGIALSPRGEKLVVAEFGESRVALIDTSNMSILTSQIVTNPRAVAISNDGDQQDDDEKLVVTEFYGRIIPGKEAKDDSRVGAVRLFNLNNSLSQAGDVLFQPSDPGAFPLTVSAANPEITAAAPNQLASVIILGDKFVATAIAAAPDTAPKFDENVYQYLLVGKLDGTSLGTISLSEEIRKLTVTGTKFFMADIHDIAAVGNSILYVLAKGGEAIQRVVLTGDTSVTLGSTNVPQIDLQTLATKCQNPIGVVTPHDVADNKNMYVNCWVTRNMGIVDLAQQKLVNVVESSASVNDAVNRGRHFFFTGRGRWSRGGEGWSGCGSCHPDGLSDNITWRFAAGPRQSTSMDGSYSHGPGAQKQRIFNWSAIFDEQHDFERNTRDVSGGVGALVKSLDLVDTSRLSLEVTAGTAIGGLAKPLRELQEGTPPQNSVDLGPSLLKDWDEIDAYVKTIRPPKARQFPVGGSASVNAGANLFQQGNCSNCHSGAGWTLSRRFFTPSSATNLALTTAPFANKANIDGGSAHTVEIAGEPGGVAVAQVACVLRKVNSFGVPGDAALTGTLELRAGRPPSAKAQGDITGYNIPSLYGLQVGAPFLHHGQAKTLTELFTDSKWIGHLQAGNAVFNNGQVLSAQQATDMANFLWSIDAAKAEIPAVTAKDGCRATFP